MRIGVLASHPIQYQAPWFRALARETDSHVFFAHRVSAVEQGKAGFGRAFDWDLDLLSGYSHTFLPNIARHPNVNHFFGCDTPQIAAETADQTFDVFIVSGWNLKCYWQAVDACRRAKIPIFVRGDSQLNPRQSLVKRATKRLTHRLSLGQFDGFLSVGERNREYLRHYGMPGDKIFFVPHFVDNERFEKQANEIRKSKLEIRKQWRIPEDAFCVLFCGKFIPKKRPLDLVRAAQLLAANKQVPRLHLLFVGSGELDSELRVNCNVVFDTDAAGAPINGEQITDNRKPAASFAGFLNQTEISRAYVAADCLVLPSDYRETWGLVVNEAMASRLPAVVSEAVGCAPDLIEEGKTGFTFSLDDSSELASKLEAVAMLKHAGHDFYLALASKVHNYSVEAAIRGTLEAAAIVIKRRTSTSA